VLAGLGLYLFLVHLVWAHRPLIRPALFRDINFSAGLVLMFAVGTLLVSSLAMMAPWLQNLGDYPVDTAGLVMAPRGFGNLVTIVISGRLSHRIDARLMVGTGLLIECWSFSIMTGWTPDVSQHELIAAIILQGAGLGLVFTPLQMLAFATLDPALRTEGASLFSLSRNIGAAIGVSVVTTMLARHSQVLHEQIGAAVTPFNRALQSVAALNPAHLHGAALLDRIIGRQAQIIAYLDDYKLLILTTIPALLLLLVMRQPREAVRAAPVEAAME
jgi:DHA2 family multidrug resistance protein